jgi:sec-independent protein translocase protein TatB
VFNIGPGELIAICMVALLVLGPERLPGAVRTVGRVVGELRRISGGFQNELRNAFEDSEIDELVRDRPTTRRSELPERAEKPHSATMKPATEATEATDQADKTDTASTTDTIDATDTEPETTATRPEKAEEDGDAASDGKSERDSETVHDTPPPPVGGTPPTES